MLWPNTLYYVAVRSTDDVPLTSDISTDLTQPITWTIDSSHTGMKYGYGHISIPYDIESIATSFTTNFQDDVYPGFNSPVYMYTWTPAGTNVGVGSWKTVTRGDALSTKANGTGFLFYSRAYTNVIEVPEATHNAKQMADHATDIWVGINLEQGRNLIGNPYLKNVKFSDIKICKNGTFDPTAASPCSGGGSSWIAFESSTDMDGAIYHYANNSTAASETCASGDCLAVLRPWWGHWVELLSDSSSDTYIMGVPEPAP